MSPESSFGWFQFLGAAPRGASNSTSAPAHLLPPIAPCDASPVVVVSGAGGLAERGPGASLMKFELTPGNRLQLGNFRPSDNFASELPADNLLRRPWRSAASCCVLG